MKQPDLQTSKRPNVEKSERRNRGSDRLAPGGAGGSVRLVGAKIWQRLIFASIASLGVDGVQAASNSPIVLKASELHVGNGNVIPAGMVVVEGDHIAAVGADLTLPPDATVIEMAAGAITPGLIDANAAIESEDVATARPSRSYGNTRGLLQDSFVADDSHINGAEWRESECPRAARHVARKACPVCGCQKMSEPLEAGVRPRAVLAEQSSEVIPETRVIDSLNLYSRDFQRLLQGGVTTVYVSPDSANR